MTYPIYNLIDGDVEKMSLVLSPAVESYFMCFSKEHPVELSFNDDKHLITGIAMLADTPIYRNNKEYGEHYVVFTKDTIERLVTDFMKQKRTCSVNLEHQEDTDGVSIVESYFTCKNKVKCELFPEATEGSWIVTYKVENPDVYAQIKEGKLKGFSVEGMFTYADKPLQTSKTEDTISLDEIIENLI